jgi:hypothetical protein
VTELSLSMPSPVADTPLRQALAAALYVLGREYRLVLIDRYRSLIVNLTDQAAIDGYLSGETDV